MSSVSDVGNANSVNSQTSAGFDGVSSVSDASVVGVEGDGSDAGTSLLPSPLSTAGDPITEVAILLAQSALTDRKSAQTQARLEDRRAVAAGLARVAALRDQAEQRLYAGILTGLGQMAEGAGSLTGAAEVLGGKKETIGNIIGGAGKAEKGLDSAFSALFEHNASADGADATEEETVASSANRAYDAARSESESARQLYDRFVQAYRELVETRNASLLAAVRV